MIPLETNGSESVVPQQPHRHLENVRNAHSQTPKQTSLVRKSGEQGSTLFLQTHSMILAATKAWQLLP